MVKIVEFPNRGNYFIRQGIAAYQAGRQGEALSAFRQAYAVCQNKAHFQLDLAQAFEEAGFRKESLDILEGVLAIRDDQDELEDYFNFYLNLIFHPEDQDRAGETSSSMGKDLLSFILFPEEDLDDDLTSDDHGDGKAESKEWLDRHLSQAGEWSENDQIAFLRLIDQLPADEEEAGLIKDVLEHYSQPSFFRTDLLTRLIACQPKETDTVTIQDDKGLDHQVNVSRLVPLEQLAFYQDGKRFIKSRNFQDPLQETAILSEWVLICSYLYPFLDRQDGEASEWVCAIQEALDGKSPHTPLEIRVHKLRQLILTSFD